MRFTRAVLAICLLLAAPAYLQAASASKDFPNDDPTCFGPAIPTNIPIASPGQVSVKLKWKSVGAAPAPMLVTSTNAYFGCETGDLLASDATLGLCISCSTHKVPVSDCEVSGVVGAVFCGPGFPAADCCVLPMLAAAVTLNLKNTENGAIMAVQKAGGGVGVTASEALAGTRLVNFWSATDAGNTIATDLLPNFVISVERRPGAADGTVTVKIDRGQPQPDTFSFSTTGKDDIGVLKALQDGFTGKSIASTVVDNHALPGLTAAAESFYGSALSVTLPPGVLKVHVKAPRGFVNQSDTSAIVDRRPTPALTTWGGTMLVGLMLLAGAWILRRSLQQ